ncbi:PP2C family protein-serine/threonine phosphatase [Persephonella sp.]
MYQVVLCMNRGLRNYQEDCIYINGEIIQTDFIECPQERTIPDKKAFFAVCDGMGGLSDGDRASYFVCSQFKEQGLPDFSTKGVQQYLYSIQKEFKKAGFIMSGTTIAGVYMRGRESIIFNVGDSRVYKYTEERLVYLSHDHSYVQSLVDKGLISQEEAFYHPAKNVVEFGIGDVFSQDWISGKSPYVKKDFLKNGEAYLICTDGLHDYMPDSEIHYYLYPDPLENFPRLISQLEKVKEDNYSVILVTV